MLIVPMGLQEAPQTRPFFAAIIATLVVYQAVLLLFFPALKPDPLAFLKADLSNPWLYWDLFLGLFRSANLIHPIVFFLFWAVLGPGLEERVGKALLVVTFLAGSLAPFIAGRLEVLAWEPGYWPGLGGMMACVGLGYYFLWESEVKIFYFLPTPFVMPVGFTSIASLFVMLFFHLVVVLSQIKFYTAREAHLRPPGVATALWLLFLPLLVLLGCFAVNKLVAVVRHSREELSAGTN